MSLTSSMTATEVSSGREGVGGSRLASAEDIMAVPSVSSWREFVSSISSQFDATVEEIDRIEKTVRGMGDAYGWGEVWMRGTGREVFTQWRNSQH